MKKAWIAMLAGSLTALAASGVVLLAQKSSSGDLASAMAAERHVEELLNRHYRETREVALTAMLPPIE